MTTLKTPYGEFALSRRATVGASVVQATRECIHRYKRLHIGDYAIVEHRKLPMFRQHVGMGWCKHVATYGLDGVEIKLRGCE